MKQLRGLYAQTFFTFRTILLLYLEFQEEGGTCIYVVS